MLLVFGGSQAVLRFNRAVAEALPSLVDPCVAAPCHRASPASPRRRRVATGCRPSCGRATGRIPFLREDMADALVAADLLVGRAGSSTLAEAAAIGLPRRSSCPIPHAAGHQEANAREMVAAGGARLVADERFDAEALVEAAALLVRTRPTLRPDAGRQPGARPAGCRAASRATCCSRSPSAGRCRPRRASSASLAGGRVTAGSLRARRRLTEQEALRLGTDIQRRIGVKTSRQEPLARFTTMRVGGPADLFAEVRNLFELRAIVRFARAREVPLFLLGRGSDLVISDAGVGGLVVKSSAQQVPRRGSTGSSPTRACRWPGRPPSPRTPGLSGLEFGLAIPGTVGGAVWANAGAHESDIAGVLVDGRRHRRRRHRDGCSMAAALGLGYRDSILKARARGSTGCRDPGHVPSWRRRTPRSSPRGSTRSAAGARRTSRWACRPRAAPSATRPGDSAGRLIDSLGLKGAREGGASVSEKHANFLVNDQGGTAADVRRLGDRVRATVRRRTGIELQYEVVFAGDWTGWRGRDERRARPLPPTAIAVLLGGPSAEHDVSLVSGRAIAAALAGRGHRGRRRGSSTSTDAGGGCRRARSIPAIAPPAFDAPGGARRRRAPGRGRGPGAARCLGAAPPVVFPALHGPFGEDGTVQALRGVGRPRLLRLGTRGVGGGHGQDAVQAHLRRRGPAGAALGRGPRAGLDGATSRRCSTELEAFAAGLARSAPGHQAGAARLQHRHLHRPSPDEPPELEAAIAAALRFDDLVMAEPYLDHPRELEVAVVGDRAADLEVFGPGEVRSDREFYDYVAKYRSAASRSDLAPDLDPAVAAKRPAHRGRRVPGHRCQRLRARRLPAGARRPPVRVRRSTPSRASRPSACSRALCAQGGYDFGGICERIVGLALERAAVAPGAPPDARGPALTRWASCVVAEGRRAATGACPATATAPRARCRWRAAGRHRAAWSLVGAAMTWLTTDPAFSVDPATIVLSGLRLHRSGRRPPADAPGRRRRIPPPWSSRPAAWRPPSSSCRRCASARVRATLPDRLTVTVTEREPILAWRVGRPGVAHGRATGSLFAPAAQATADELGDGATGSRVAGGRRPAGGGPAGRRWPASTPPTSRPCGRWAT